jgi:ABC-type amino acid transport substrate-binding protein
MVASAPAVPGRIFISYRREETAYPAGWLFDRLADRFGGGQVFKDVDSIEPGDDFVEVITRAVGSCDVLLALIGGEWLTITDAHGRRRLDNPDDFVRLEIEAALERGVRVIPILVDGARMPTAEELPASLARLVRRQALELSPARFDHDLGRLLRVLDRTLTEVRPAPPAPPSPEPPPDHGERRAPPNVALALRPVVSHGRSSGEHHLTAANLGDRPVGVAFDVDGAPDLAAEVTPRALPVEAGGSVTATLRARPRRRLLAGRSRRHGFRVLARVAGTPVAAAEGAMLQRPLTPWWLLAAALLVVLLPVAALLRPQPSLAVPDPAGAAVSDATALLERAGLRPEVTREASETVAPGSLIRTEPSPGERVRRGARVALVVSSGPAVTPLPPGTGELGVGFVDWFAASKDNPGSLLKGFEPILFADESGQLQGLDVDLANELAARLNVKASFNRHPHFTHSLSDVAKQRVTISLSVLRDRAEGREDVDFIDYLDPDSALLVPTRNRDAIRSLDDLCGGTVVRPIEMTAGSLVEQSRRCEDRGRPGITLMSCPQLTTPPDADEAVPIRECPAGGDPLRLVLDGQVDAAVLDLPVAERLVKTSSVGGQLTIARARVESAPYGIAVRKGDSAVRDAVRSALRAVIADGTYDRILAKWKLQRRALKTATVNGGP